MRAIWLDDDFFDIHSEVELSDALAYLWRAYNAAPADPVEAARDAMLKAQGGGLPVTLAYAGADAVLKALGWEKP